MQIKDYIKGNKHGKEANRLEREAMNDEFLQEAMDGFDAVQGNHAEIIERLERKICLPPTIAAKNNSKILYFSAIAASVLLLIGFGVYFMMDTKEQNPVIAMAQTIEYKESASELPKVEPQSPVYTEEMEISTSIAVAEIQSARTLQRPIQAEEINLDQQNEIFAFTDDNIRSNEMLVVIDSIVVQTQQLVSAEDGIEEVIAVSAEIDYSVERSTTQLAARAREEVADVKKVQAPFGEKEFEAYCLKNAVKNICGSDSISVKVSFFIDAAGKPINIKYDLFTCENAKKEMERLLSVSPAWTAVNEQINMTVTW